jgi:DNA polymerase III gamma/tau subunit
MFSIDYRPKDFDEVVGNKAQVDSLRRLIESENRPHCYLLCGISGVGKTTLARICAEKLGASELSTFEINASNLNGVDAARALIEEIPIYGMGGEAKVYIIDEVDKTTDYWQSAMKKPLEDVPKHVYFFLCSEEKKKIKKAIQTRSVNIDLNPIRDEEMQKLLRKIYRKEEVSVESEVIDAIIDSSLGSARQAVVFLEQILGLPKEEALEVIVTGTDDPEIRDLCRALLDQSTKWRQVASLLKGIKAEPEGIRRAVLGYMNAVLLNSGKQRAFDLIDIFEDSLFNSGKAGLTAMCYEAVEGV